MRFTRFLLTATLSAACLLPLGAQPQQGERKCWFPQDNEADDGGRFIMAPGFALKN
ncbi:MAG: hypothetical protein J6T92_02430 [Ottowia sp.]|nr:hypothetical protein [Ottowia sp.]